MTVGPLEVLLLIFLVLLVVGGRWIPTAARGLGGGMRSLFDGVRGLHPAEDETKTPAELEERSAAEKPKTS